jgi:hypothetical protein
MKMLLSEFGKVEGCCIIKYLYLEKLKGAVLSKTYSDIIYARELAECMCTDNHSITHETKGNANFKLSISPLHQSMLAHTDPAVSKSAPTLQLYASFFPKNNLCISLRIIYLYFKFFKPQPKASNTMLI